MKIEILVNAKSFEAGDQVLQNVKEALDRTDIEAEVHIYHDVHKMIDHRVYVAPALMIDDAVRIAGRIPETREIISIFAERPRYHKRLKKVA
ncbi:MAG: thioredoxin family protein [Desulfuromonadales bacterium]|nr:thioredoxin family protein [Desulfuromonadales bacterium]